MIVNEEILIPLSPRADETELMCFTGLELNFRKNVVSRFAVVICSDDLAAEESATSLGANGLSRLRGR